MDRRKFWIPSSKATTHDYPSSSTPGANNLRRHPFLNALSPAPEQPYGSFYLPTAYSEQSALEESISATYSELEAVEEALSRVSLGGGHRQPFRPPPSPIAGKGYCLRPFLDTQSVVNGSLERYNGVVNSGQNTVGFGVGPVIPAVDPLRDLSAFLPDSWYRDDTIDYNVGLHRSHNFLLRKKQLLNSQFGYFPISSTNNVNNVRSDLSNQLVLGHDLEDFRGRIVQFAKDQYGCRILQLKFENPSHQEIEMVLTEVIDHMGELMTNQFSNYLIQKLVAVCNDEQRVRIIRSLNKYPFQLIIICKNPHGAKAVQNLLECYPHQAVLLIAALSPGAAALVKDPNGHHVIQYCLINFSYICNQILKEITDYCFEIAIDRSGCCVLQTCVQISQGETRHRLVSQILANAIHLAADPYGNYVLQHMLGMRIPEITEDLLNQLEGNYVSLACNKYGSNVVEKCLVESMEEQSTKIIMEIVRSTNAPKLLLDPYGNFVIQSALTVCKGLARNSLVNLVQQNVSSMRSNLYGKKILESLEKKKVQQAHN